jgi:hypothetical protein
MCTLISVSTAAQSVVAHNEEDLEAIEIVATRRLNWKVNS